ncbi:uncharacterized protein CcaverHIS019_0205070 [Cutaneotrichosporon cavernicola]|uniref:Uncharacterized protein n=1 Tax=Cutaneotrichosporon cavernicola TaxID=279322 RepID=A0AA48I8Q6_9TREE|nr:uncharacterized protein CcaverHIS019_0205070 [Cutaneotrichosporon cavernicola]BEI89145.1 hypothetical protein CcaverHIS019_0205070 [Cutaneotrichosporon cavernicola]
MSSAARRDRRYDGVPRQRAPPSPNSDFVEFVHRVLDICFSPITFPIRVIRDILTPPLTISVVIKGILAVLLILASAAFSTLAVGAFWWSWGVGGNVEVEGWLTYGSRTIRTPHATLQLPVDRFQEDLPYDVQVELELVRPSQSSEEMGNFMVTLDLRSLRAPEVSIVHVSQPSLPPPPLKTSLVSLPSIPTWYIPPCVIPWPFRSFCPSRVFGYAGVPDARIKERRRRGSLVSPARGNEVVLLTKELIEGTVINPGRGDLAIGSAFVSIGRDDTNLEAPGARYHREVRTTGWVVVRFVPHPTGLRWLMTANPLPPLIILPPVSFSLTVVSALIGFLVISFMGRRKGKPEEPQKAKERKKRVKDDPPERPDPRLAQLDRIWDARTSREETRAWDAIEARAAARRVASPFDVVQVVEHTTPRTHTPELTPHSTTDEETATETDGPNETTSATSATSGATGTGADTTGASQTGTSGSTSEWSDTWSDDQRY